MNSEFTFQIGILEEIGLIFPDIRIGILTGKVVNLPYNDSLWKEIEKEIFELGSKLDAEQIRDWAPIRDAKDAYR